MSTSHGALKSQTTALEKIQHGYLPISLTPDWVEPVRVGSEEPNTEERDVLNVLEETKMDLPVPDPRGSVTNSIDIPARRTARYEVDGGVTIAGGRPGEEIELEGSNSDSSSVTLPPPYLSISYP